MQRFTAFACAGASALAAVLAFTWANPTAAEPKKPSAAVPKAKKGSQEQEVALQLDALIAAEWAAQKLEPSEACDDAEFLRRVALDITGQIPTADDARAFLLSNDPDKRRKKIDELLDSPLYAEHWAFTWAQRLMGGSRLLQAGGDRAGAYREWFRDAFATNKPYNAFVHDIVAAEGDSQSNGATAWLVSLQDAGEAGMAASATRHFLGVQIQCAQCHDSKVNDWKIPDFWGIAAFFARTRVRRVIDPQTKMPTGVFEIVDLPRGEVAIPESNPPKVVDPRFLEGKPLPRPGGTPKPREFKNPRNPERTFIAGPADGVERRKEFANWLTADDNKWFAKAAVNWYWGTFTGAGFVEPLDDLDVTNPPSIPAAIEYLAADFKVNGYDLKRLIRTICNTRAYQLSSKPTASNAHDERFYTHRKLDHLTPDQMFYSLMSVTGIENALARGMDRDRVEQLKQRFLAGFVFLFGNDEGEAGDAFNGTIPQALLLMNNVQIQNGLKVGPTTTLGKILQKHQAVEARRDAMYLTVLGRFPSETEKSYFASVINKYQNSKLIYEDVYWALVNSAEFQFNH
ncbi:MAG: DUF1549 domain-containing protein [Planctomycetia bacterium]|nr:DUF1549 domain-containing protein [Planctomycetia bacterium]